MTKRQNALGVTEYGYQRGIVDGEFLADHEAFLAKAATIKKGQYFGRTIAEMWFSDWPEWMAHSKLEQMKPFFFGLTATKHEHFNYTDTHGLDCLTVR